MQVLYLLSYEGPDLSGGFRSRRHDHIRVRTRSSLSWMERETGLEPATLSLEG